MLRDLNCEFRKLKQAKNIKISFIIIVLGMVYSFVMNNPDSLDPPKSVMMLPLYIFSSMTVIIAIMCAIFTGRTVMKDYDPQTKRISVYFTKLIVIFASFLFFFLTVLLLIYTVGFLLIGWNPQNHVYHDYGAKYMIAIGMVLVHFLAYSSLFTMFSFLFKKPLLYMITYLIAEVFVPEYILPLSGRIMFPYLSRAVKEDILLTPEFLGKFIPGAVIIAVSTLVGVIAFLIRTHSDGSFGGYRKISR